VVYLAVAVETTLYFSEWIASTANTFEKTNEARIAIAANLFVVLKPKIDIFISNSYDQDIWRVVPPRLLLQGSCHYAKYLIYIGLGVLKV